MLLKAVMAAAVLGFSFSPAAAQWIAQSQGGAFDDNPLHIAVTATGRYGFGLRCRGDNLEVAFMTPEKSSDEDLFKVMNAAGPKLRLRIDKGSIIDLDATIDEADETLRVIADANLDLYLKVRDAKSSVSVVLTVLGQNFHETTFNVRGSKAAINKIIKGCNLQE